MVAYRMACGSCTDNGIHTKNLIIMSRAQLINVHLERLKLLLELRGGITLNEELLKNFVSLLGRLKDSALGKLTFDYSRSGSCIKGKIDTVYINATEGNARSTIGIYSNCLKCTVTYQEADEEKFVSERVDIIDIEGFLKDRFARSFFTM